MKEFELKKTLKEGEVTEELNQVLKDLEEAKRRLEELNENTR